MNIKDGSIDMAVSDVLLAEEETTFDPMRDLYMAQSSKPSQVTTLNLRTLTPYQRALLVIDGTVTKFIEAYSMEQIEIVRLSQEVQQLSEDHAWLEAAKGTDVMAREVLLQGKYSHRLHAYAVSLILPDRISNIVQQKLELDGEGIGRILLNSKLESRREVLWYGKENFKRLPEAIRHLTNGEFLSRTYRIIAHGQPLMLINEKFPSGTDWPLSRY